MPMSGIASQDMTSYAGIRWRSGETKHEKQQVFHVVRVVLCVMRVN
jgi:hypothetical protein